MDERQKPAMLRKPNTTKHHSQNLGHGAGAYMRDDMMDTHVRTTAFPTLWEKSYLCPCRNRETMQPNPSCKRCYGRGVAFLPPKEIMITIQSQEKGIMNADLGLLDSGTAIGTPDRIYRISFRDRITLPLAKISQSLIFDATRRRIDNGFYMIYDVEAIDFATTMNKELKLGVDYEFDNDTNRFYPKEHLFEEIISINITTKLRYMVADLLKEHRYSRDERGEILTLPQKLLLKREDIFVDKEHFDCSTDEGQMIDTKRNGSADGLNGFFRGGL